MIHLSPVELEGHGVRLEPLTLDHAEALDEAAADGEQWRLFFTFVPKPGEATAYITAALAGRAEGTMLPWLVRDAVTGKALGSTRYHDVVPALDRVEIGYTWYGVTSQRSHVNTACKLLLLGHAFDTVGCAVVGLRTDALNLRSQRAIEALGARRDGVLRHHGLRSDGSPRDDVMYSILSNEWPDIRRHLETRLWRHDMEGALRRTNG